MRFIAQLLGSKVAARSRLNFNVAAESNSFEMLHGLVLQANLISFQIRIGAPAGGKEVVARDIDDRDVPRANLVLGQLRSRIEGMRNEGRGR
jgi:hypothetical protein